MHPINRRAACATLASLTLGISAATRSRAAGMLNVQGIPTDSGLELNYAQAGGFVQAANLAINIQLMAVGSAAESAVVGGSLQIGLAPVGALAIARERGLPVAIVAPSALYSTDEPTSELLVPGDSPVKIAADLNNKTIAVNGLNTIAQYGPQAWIADNGGDASSIKWIEIPFAEMPVALGQHRVDAALVAEPALTLAKLGGARLLAKAFDAVGKHFVLAAWYATEPWIAANSDTVRSFVEMIYKSARWANTHRAETAKVLEQIGHLKPEVIGKITRSPYAEHYDAKLMQPQIDLSYRFHALKVPMTSGQLVAKVVRL